jgi:uncharacterized protein YrrD
MADLGDPIAYLALQEGTPVLASDGVEIGRVAHVLADESDDIFEGIVVDESVLPGGHRYADEEIIEAIHEHGVVLTIDSAAAEELPKPSEAPGVIEVGVDDLVADKAQSRLQKAWKYISGDY